MSATAVDIGRVSARDLLDREGKTKGVYCVRACAGYVGGHIRGTRGQEAKFIHPSSGRVWVVFRCSCGAYWKREDTSR